jgi:kinesin family protein 5
MKIREDKLHGVYVADVTEDYVDDCGEVLDLIKAGNSNRETSATLMNEDSSRSHAIFMLTLSQTNLNDFSGKTGKLCLVDLAGSEKVSKSGAEGRRLDEAKNINLSLSTLGTVIYRLTDGVS